VLVRGRTVLPHTREAFQLLTHPETGHFLTPTIFCTNAGNTLRRNKAQQLTKWLGVEVRRYAQILYTNARLETTFSFLVAISRIWWQS
jgi:ribonucleotide monophosphatase NagD (HAD superfamily)